MMNKKDIAAMRRQFKLDNDLLTISNIYNVYIRQESSDVYYEEIQPFEMLEREQQEMFMANFKKVLTGKMDQKIFEVKFERPSEEDPDHTQQLLYEGLETTDLEEWKENMLHIAEKMVQDTQYEHDLVVTFIRGEYFKPTKRHSDETEIDMRDEVYTNTFTLCSMNPTEQPKQSLVFDFLERSFKSNLTVDPIINLNKPIGGFLFPCFSDGARDVNHILYQAAKPNQPDMAFIETVLNGGDIVTAAEDKTVFEEIVNEVVGHEVNTHTLANVYEEINRMVDEEKEEDMVESATLDSKAVEHVLRVSGVENVDRDTVEEAFQSVVDDEHYELKAQNIIPNYTSKSIKINTKVANISISPQDLKYVNQVEYNGRRCLMIEVDEDTMVEGFKLIPVAKINTTTD